MRLTLTFFLFASSAALTLSAQESAQISGFVYDRSEAAVPGVALSITRSGTGIAFRTSSDRSGHFVFAALPPGPYSLDLKKEGFQTAVANDIELHVNDRQELIFHLEIGPLSQTVFVSGSTPVVNTADGSVSTVVDRGFVDNLPMNGRTFQSLIRLTPGVVFTPTGGGNFGQFVVNGMRSDDNYFTVDGVSASFGLGGTTATTLYQGGGGQLPALSVLGSTNSLVSMDAMEEFRIQTSSFAPEFGRLPGAQVSIVTRSGSNRLHGSLSEYFRHDALNADEWFANKAGLPKAKERSNVFSGVLGGPIVKDRTFFFASYEGQRVDLPVTLSGTVPSAAIRAAAPAAIQPFLAAFPLPTGAALADGSAPFTVTASNPASLDAYSLRLDHHAGKFALFGRYSRSPSTITTQEAATQTVGHAAVKTATAGVTYTVSPRALNELRANYSSDVTNVVFEANTLGGAVPLSQSLLPGGTTTRTGEVGFVILSLAGASGAGALLGGFSQNTSTQYNVTDTLSLSFGRHQVKLGFDYRRLTPSVSSPDLTEIAAFNGIAGPGGVSSGLPLTIAVTRGPGHPVTVLTRNYSVFAQDAWSVSSRLTLTYGLRWDANPPLKGADADSALYPLTNVGAPSTIGVGAKGGQLYKASWTNLAPRIGVNYQARRSSGSETVISGGFGLFYSASLGTIASVTGGFPFYSQGQFSLKAFPLTDALLASVPPVGQLPVGAIYGADPNVVTPRTRQWNVSVQQALGSAQSLTVSYSGSAGRDLYRKNRYSAPNASFTNSIYVTDNSGWSNYNALQVKLDRRLTRGLQALGSYTWSHSLDNASDDQSFAAVSPNSLYNPNVDSGSSDFDVRHAVSGALTYRIPPVRTSGPAHALLRDWAINAVLSGRSAMPLNVTAASVTIGGVIWAPRPNVVSGAPLYLYGAQYPGGMAINPAAFASPGKTQGNLGRNALRGFGAWQADLTVHRQFNLAEHIVLQLRAEFFNVLNHPNFGPPNTSTTGAQFGLATQTLANSNSVGGLNPIFQLGGPRSSQLGVRVQF